MPPELQFRAQATMGMQLMSVVSKFDPNTARLITHHMCHGRLSGGLRTKFDDNTRNFRNDLVNFVQSILRGDVDCKVMKACVSPSVKVGRVFDLCLPDSDHDGAIGDKH